MHLCGAYERASPLMRRYMLRCARSCLCALCFMWCPDCMKFTDQEFPACPASLGGALLGWAQRKW